MTDFGDPRIGALLTFLDLALLADKDDPRRQYAFLDHVRECVESRLVTARAAVAAEVRRERGKTPPPRRPISQTMPNATAQTERHNTAQLAAQLEEQREFGERPTPDAFEPSAIVNTHPGRERDR